MVGRFLGREKTYAEKTSSEWRRDALHMLRDLDRKSTSLASAKEEFDHHVKQAFGVVQKAEDRCNELMDRVERSVESARDMFERYDHVDETLHEQLKIMRDVIIPGLTSSNEMVRQEMESHISLLVRMQEAHAPRTREV
jgi:hypothetical protein